MLLVCGYMPTGVGRTISESLAESGSSTGRSRLKCWHTIGSGNTPPDALPWAPAFAGVTVVGTGRSRLECWRTVGSGNTPPDALPWAPAFAGVTVVGTGRSRLECWHRIGSGNTPPDAPPWAPAFAGVTVGCGGLWLGCWWECGSNPWEKRDEIFPTLSQNFPFLPNFTPYSGPFVSAPLAAIRDFSISVPFCPKVSHVVPIGPMGQPIRSVAGAGHRCDGGACAARGFGRCANIWSHHTR